MSVAQRFGKEGYAVALISRSADRHADYLQALDAADVEAAAFTADAADPVQLRAAVDAVRKHFGRIDVGYYGPAAMMSLAGDITTLAAADAESALREVVPAVDFASLLLPSSPNAATADCCSPAVSAASCRCHRLADWP